ncbi:cilia- and flagella-associated protein 161-like [Scaptodrosophila lebanonensis]|uniref:Cilia- and flagella-associated protein 161-like n=1 Tax=Drosophila lebanonensis TaxID=7225 RepID=A0A6J2UJW5_DROLE|nr:cilia- and flagella-associated protein 161-like [Scaptodrosophila lebanonensis]
MPCTPALLDTSSNRFSPSVRIGNWYEDSCLEEHKQNVFKRQRDRGELLVEKARALFDNFHKEVVLNAPKKHLSFGAVVQIMPIYVNLCDVDTSDMNPALSVIINEQVVRSSQSINEECELTVAPSDRSCVRNSFRIVSGDSTDRTNEVLKYGQHFRFECVEPVDDPIWLYSAPKQCNLLHPIRTTFDSHKQGEVNYPLGLVHRSNCGIGRNVPTAHSNWFCIHVDPNKRFESEGKEMPSNSPIVIVHAATNRNLAVENVVIQTLFGPEFLVSVQNYRNIYRRETWKNVWMISNGHQTNAKRVPH